MFTRCDLDSHGFLIGKEVVEQSAVPRDDEDRLVLLNELAAPDGGKRVYCRGECDLPTDSTYQWNNEDRRFEPIHVKLPRSLRDSLDAYTGDIEALPAEIRKYVERRNRIKSGRDD